MKMLVYIEKASNGNCSLSSYKLKIKKEKEEGKKKGGSGIINKYRRLDGWIEKEKERKASNYFLDTKSYECRQKTGHGHKQNAFILGISILLR